MIGTVPKRPTGSSPQARFVQWVWDSLVYQKRASRAPGAKTSSTSGGVFIEPLETGGNLSSGSRVNQYLLTDATNGDYFVCRTLSIKEGAAEEDPPEWVIGRNDIFIAKPFHLR